MSRTRWALAAALVAILGLGLWLVRAQKSELTKERRAPRHESAEAHDDAAELVKAADARTIPVSAPIAPRSDTVRDQRTNETPAPSANSAEGQVVGPHAHDPRLPGMLPHPENDPVRQRLHAENRLIQNMNDAMSFRRVNEMRELLVQYRKLDPNDVEAYQAGYEIIADCIEFRGDASLAAARKFYDMERQSPLRRFVRRICFENTN
jgi:FtsZ-interacting cell division protein ZipA